MRPRSVRATPTERTRHLPGDALIESPVGSLTHAITIDVPPPRVWPWLAQMGAGSRAGWYSYDTIDNGRRRSATRIVPSLQDVEAGTLFPAVPGATDGFHVVDVEAGRHLVLGWQPDVHATPLVTWAFVLDAVGDSCTRLVVRARAGQAYPFYGLPPWIGLPFIRGGHFVMQRRQLLGIARRAEASDALLDAVLPDYDIAERHGTRVAAPAPVTLAAAREADLMASRFIRGIFRVRELILRATRDETPRPTRLLDQMTSIGWRILAEQTGREVVVGAVTQPWLADVVFRGLPPHEFRAFNEPGYVKIVWTLRADAVGDATSIFRTETRVLATDPAARAKLRRYWARFSPGILLIRRLLLRQVRRDAERRVATHARERTAPRSPGSGSRVR